MFYIQDYTNYNHLLKVVTVERFKYLISLCFCMVIESGFVKLVVIRRNTAYGVSEETVQIRKNGLDRGENTSIAYSGLVAIKGERVLGTSSSKEGWEEQRRTVVLEEPRLNEHSLKFREGKKEGFWIGIISDISTLPTDLYKQLTRDVVNHGKAMTLKQTREELRDYWPSEIFAQAYFKTILGGIEEEIKNTSDNLNPPRFEREDCPSKLLIKCLKTKGRLNGLKTVLSDISSLINHDLEYGGKFYKFLRDLERKFAAKLEEFDQPERIRLFRFDYPIKE